MRFLIVIVGLAFVAGCSSQGALHGSASNTAQPALMALNVAPVAVDQSIGQIEPVALFYGQMPTGVTISHDGRIFVCFPRWGDDVTYTVAELRNNYRDLVPYPDFDVNQPSKSQPASHFISVQSVVVGPDNRLWILDTGSIEFGPTAYGGPKLVCIDLKTNRIVRTILFPAEVALKTSYLNDVRFDLRRGQAGFAYITDSSSTGPNAIVVVDLASGKSWRKLSDHPSVKAAKDFVPIVEGRPLMLRQPGSAHEKNLNMGADGIAISADGKTLYYCPLASRELYSVSTDALADRNLPDSEVAKTVRLALSKGCASDGLETDPQGRIYVTDYENNAILRFNPASGFYETLVHDNRMLWPDTLSVGKDGYLYFICNQLERMPRWHWGNEYRQKPYVLFRTKIDAGPVGRR